MSILISTTEEQGIDQFHTRKKRSTLACPDAPNRL